jgi:hypothetical protein
VRFSLHVVSVLMLIIAAGCTHPTGSPSPQPTTGGSAAATSTGTTLVRPREVKLDSVSPCGLWTAEQLSQLDLVANPRPATSTAGDAMCSFDLRNLQASSLNLLTVVDHDVMDVVDTGQGDIRLDIAGFPAFRQSAEPGSVRPCKVLVSTAAGQFLETDLFYGETSGGLSSEQACELTTKAAMFAVQTLLGQR